MEKINWESIFFYVKWVPGMLFMGTYHNSIDQKNRMIVPSKHREQLGGRCILTRGLDPCLNIYSMEDWEKQVEKMSELPSTDRDVREFIRHFYANAVECEFDKQGRIVIPQDLKAYAHINRDLVTMGAMKKIEVWAEEVWNTPEYGGKMNSEIFGNSMTKYNI